MAHLRMVDEPNALWSIRHMVQFLTNLAQIRADELAVKIALKQAGLSTALLSQIAVKALKTQRRQTGVYQTNRDSRWSRPVDDPQYGSEIDCYIVLVRLYGQIFCFDNAPPLAGPLKQHLEQHYVGTTIAPGTYRDSLLLERFDFADLVAEGLKPVHGHSSFHLGHEDPTIIPKHQPGNTAWRTHRSNLIQGNMTLREARIYFVQLIGRYFELGEINIV